MNPTTRRYPRSLSDAFPDERYFAIEAYIAPWWRHSLPELIVAAGAIAAVVFVIVS